MAKRVVVTLLDGIEAVAPLLDKLPEVGYTLLGAEPNQLCEILEKNLSMLTDDEEVSFVIVLSRDNYFKEAEERSVAELLTGSGIKAEPVCLVVSDSFTWKDIEHVIHHNHLFFELPKSKTQRASRRTADVFRGYVDKALLDYSLNSKLIELISTEFLSFVEKEEMKLSKEEIEQLNMELETRNRIDELTQLLNRKGLLEYFHMAKGRATRERWRLQAKTLQVLEEPVDFDGEPDGELGDFFGHLSCMMIDIDNFKHVNDTYGHIVGDEVLRGIGQLFNEEGIFRREDVCGRFGGEEFVVILPATSARHAVNPAEKLRVTVEGKEFRNTDGETFRVTVSIGIAELEESEESIEDLLNKADMALYKAKQTGKNRTVIYESGRASTEAVSRTSS